MIKEALKFTDSGQTVALVTVTKQVGSTPAEPGKMMLVKEDGTFVGTVGGGRLEFKSISMARECIEREVSKAFKFDLEKDLAMTCGGYVEIFINVLKPEKTLVIVGGGHIGRVLEKIARNTGFNTIVIDEREEIANRDRFPQASQVILGDIKEECIKLESNSSSFIVIASHGHAYDQVALESLIEKEYKYIGVIGSKNKISTMFKKMKNKGFSLEQLDKVHAPIGLAIGGNSPEDIAVGILAEIIMVKNKGQGISMKDKKGSLRRE